MYNHRLYITKTIVVVDKDVPTYITDALRSLMLDGQRITAIKLLRGWAKDTNIDQAFGLKEAKDWVEENFPPIK